MVQLANEHLDEAKEADTPKEMLHEMRKSIDALIQWSGLKKAEDDISYGREMALVHTKLQEAKMWAGKCLEAIGSELPVEFRDKAE